MIRTTEYWIVSREVLGAALRWVLPVLVLVFVLGALLGIVAFAAVLDA